MSLPKNKQTNRKASDSFLLNGCLIAEASAKLKITMLRKHIKKTEPVSK